MLSRHFRYWGWSVAFALLGAPLAWGASLNPNGSPNTADPALVLWLDASDTSTLFTDTAGTSNVTASGDLIARWNDKSGSGMVFQQGTATRRPVFTAASPVNGAPAVTNTGGSGSTATALTSTTGNSTGVTGNADRTLITVWQNTAFTGQNYQHSVHFGDQTTNQAYGHSTSRGGNAGSPIGNHYYGAGFDTSATADLAAHLAVSTWDGTGGSGANGLDSWYVDGIFVGASDRGALATGAGQYQIGSRLGPFTEGFTGHLLEVIMFNEVLSEDELNLLGGYIQTKYGIEVANATFNVIPEPSSIAVWILVGVALLAAVGLRRRRR